MRRDKVNSFAPFERYMCIVMSFLNNKKQTLLLRLGVRSLVNHAFYQTLIVASLLPLTYSTLNGNAIPTSGTIRFANQPTQDTCKETRFAHVLSIDFIVVGLVLTYISITADETSRKNSREMNNV